MMEPRSLSSSRDEKACATRTSLVLLLVLLSFADITNGWVPVASTQCGRLSDTGFVYSCDKNRGERRSLRLSATLIKEPGSPSSFSADDDGDDNDEDPFQSHSNQELKITDASLVSLNGQEASAAHLSDGKKPKRSSQNPAMGDTGFLRKRTSNLLLHAATDVDPSDASLSSRGMKVERKTFHFLFDAWAFSGEVDAAEQALQLLDCMEELGTTNPSIKPDVRSYTKVINAISRSASLTAGEDAERILHKMENLFKSGYFAVKPNTFTYTAVMEAHANSGVPGSAERAEELCRIMIEKYKAGESDVKPTARSFNAVINAYGKAGEAAMAEAVFDHMEALYESGVTGVKPTTFNYNALISALANSGEQGSAERAEQVLERMEYLQKSGDGDVKPTTVSFNAVIDAYAKSGKEGAAEKGEDLLKHMGELSDSQPNTRSFNSVINAWAKSKQEDAAFRAEELLDLMKKLYQEGNKEVRPDVHSFCTVINAWARSQKPGKAERAYNLFREMKNLYEDGNKHVRPNVVAINAVMNACAFTIGDVREQNRAMEIAHKILRELENSPYGKPDQVTYGTFLKVCCNQMPDSHTREQIVEVLFKKCCKDGQVGNFVLQQLKTTSSPELYEKLVGKSIYESVQMEDLPNEWWCNVVDGKWRRKRFLS